MRLKEHFDYSKYSEVLHLNKFELAFCLGYFVLALGLCLYSTPGGSLFSSDSIGYVQQAEGIYKNNNFLTINHAPLYPTLIAFAMGLGLTSEQSAAIIPIIFYSLLGFPLFLLGRIISRPITGYLSCIASLFCSKYLLYVSTYAWTEMPYIFFTVVAILFVAIFNRYGYVSSINIAAIFIFLATLTRYIGFVLIPVGIIIIAMNIKDFKKALKTILSFSLISIVPVGIWTLVQMTNASNAYVMTTTVPIRPFSTTIHQFRVNLEQLFYNDYGSIALIVMLFVVIAIIAIYLNKRLTAFAKDTIPLAGYIAIYCIMMILMNTSYGNYTLTNALHLRYIIPIIPFVVLFVFSSFSDIYNKKNIQKAAYQVLPIILCTLLVAQGANSLYLRANDIRMLSINQYSDREDLHKYISENNITPNDKIYIDYQIGDTAWSNFQMMRHFEFNTAHYYGPSIRNNIPGKTILDKITAASTYVGPTSLAELIKKNKNKSIYMIVPYNVAQVYWNNTSRDICLTNPVKFSESFICRVDLKNNGTCNTSSFPRDYIIDSSASSIMTALAGNFIGQKHHQLLILKSNPSSTKEIILQILDFAKGPPVRVEYEDRTGAAWLNANHSLLSGDFMGLGYDQAFHIERHPTGDKIVIEDFSQGKPPAIVRYSEVLANNSALKNLADAEDAQFAGDFLGRGYSQVLFIDHNPKDRKLEIADFSEGRTPEMTEFSEIGGNSTLLSSLLEDKDKQFAGDFMSLGHIQLLMINCNHTNAKEPMIIISDFSKEKKSASVIYQENWGETSGFGGWLNADDTQLVGDFMGLGYSKVLFVNHNHTGGKIRVVDFSRGKPSGKYWESWNQGSIFQGWLDINDTRIAGDFKELGYSQVLFLNSSNNGSNATIVEFVNGKPEIAL